MSWKRIFIGLACVGLAVPPGAVAIPLLSEVYYDAPGADDGQLFVEISGTPGASLDGWIVEGINGSNGAAGPTVLLSGVFDASGLFVVADQTAEGTTSVVGAQLLASFDFQNGPDSIVLRAGDEVLDAIGYGSFGASEVFAGEGQPAPDVSPGQSLARHFANVDSDDNAVDFRVLEVPTPGVADFAAVPEPGAALTLGLGLAGLASVGRARPLRRRSTASAELARL